jgi:hypothetical protein
MESESVFGLGAELDVYRASACFVGVVSFALLVRLITAEIEKRLEGPYLEMVYRMRYTMLHYNDCWKLKAKQRACGCCYADHSCLQMSAK